MDHGAHVPCACQYVSMYRLKYLEVLPILILDFRTTVKLAKVARRDQQGHR